MSETPTQPAISAGLVIEPGDRVLIALANANVPRSLVDDMLGQLHDHFPGVDFAMIGGVTALAVMPAADDPPA